MQVNFTASRLNSPRGSYNDAVNLNRSCFEMYVFSDENVLLILEREIKIKSVIRLSHDIPNTFVKDLVSSHESKCPFKSVLFDVTF